LKKNPGKICTQLYAFIYLHPIGCITMRRDVFQGIADPTRRAILGRLIKEKLNLTTLADYYDISRQSVTKHIRILEECGLVSIEKQGRERYLSARPEKLSEVARWIEQYRVFFAGSYDRLDDYLKNME
jgi:DNA-binding transcriptional ArsR family regulator